MGNMFLDIHVMPSVVDFDSATVWTVSNNGWQYIEISTQPGLGDGMSSAVMLADMYAQGYQDNKSPAWDEARVYVHRDTYGYSYCLGEGSAQMRKIDGVTPLRERIEV